MATKTSNRIKCGLINIQSVSNKTFDLYELIEDHDLDILALTETWLSECDTAKIREMTPAGTHRFLHVPRGTRGGGVGIFLSTSFKKITKKKCEVWSTFEVIQVSCEIRGRKHILIVI